MTSRINVNFNGDCLTNDEVVERVRIIEDERKNKAATKTKATKRNLNFDQQSQPTLTEETTQTQEPAEMRIKYKKCKKQFHANMLACEKYASWLCKETCLPKKYIKDILYIKDTPLLCSRNCKKGNLIA